MRVCLLASTKVDQTVSERSVEQGRRPGIWSGELDQQRVQASTQGIASGCESRECHMQAPSLLLLPAEEEERTWLSVLVFYASLVCRSS